MIFPMRCFTCGKPLSHLWEKYEQETKKGKSAQNLLDSMGVERYCCRSLFLTHVNLVKTAGVFQK